MKASVASLTSSLCKSSGKIALEFQKRVRDVSSMEKPSRGGEKRTAGWASHPEEQGSDDVAAPPLCDHRGVPHRWVVLHRCHPSGSTADPRPGAAASWPASAGAADDGVVDVPQPFIGRPVPRQLLRNAWLDVTTIMPTTACHR